MRILLNMPSQFAGKPSGVAVVAFRLLERFLAQTDHQYVLLSPWSRAQLSPELADSRLDVVERPRPKIMVADIARQAISMGQWCRSRDVDVLFNIDPFGSSAGGSRRITVVHDLYFREIPGQYGARERLTNDLILRHMVAASRNLVCVSDATRAKLEQFYPAAIGKAVTIHSGPSLLAGGGASDGQRTVAGRYFLAVGNATPNKNFGVLGQAFAQVHAIDPTLKLVHVGFDPDDTLGQALGEAARTNLLRLQNLGADALAELYRNALALCVPSLAEGFCLPILEAQQMGCPVICSDRSAMPEIAGAGALPFDPTSTSSLVQAMSRIAGEPELCGALAKAGTANLTRFDWGETARRYVDLFEGNFGDFR